MLPQISKQPVDVPTPDHLGLSAPDIGETEAGVFPRCNCKHQYSLLALVDRG